MRFRYSPRVLCIDLRGIVVVVTNITAHRKGSKHLPGNDVSRDHPRQKNDGFVFSCRSLSENFERREESGGLCSFSCRVASVGVLLYPEAAFVKLMLSVLESGLMTGSIAR